MRVLIDITHPAHVHLFRHLIRRLEEGRHEVLVTSREKDVTTELLDALGIEHLCLGSKGSGLIGMAGELIARYARLLKCARRFGPDVMLALNGVTIGPVGAMLNVPRVVLEEAEHAKLQRMISLPLASRIMTGTGYVGDHGTRQRRFRGLWVQAYLAPRYFTADPRPLRQAGVDPDEPFIVLRNVSWAAAHDVGLRGANAGVLVGAVRRLSRFGRVLISSEPPLPEPLGRWANPVPVEHLHDLLAFASLYLGEGGTMAAEAGVLGTPAVFCSPLRCGYLTAMEKDYGLVRIADSMAEGLPIAEELLRQPDLREQWQAGRQKLLDDSEDVVEFMYNTLEESVSKRGQAAGDRPRRSPRWIWRLAGLALVAVILFYVGRALYVRVQDVQWAQTRINPAFIALAMLCFLVTRLMGAVTFGTILSAFGAKIGWLRSVSISCMANLGRYVPGKVASVAGASSVLALIGVRLPIALASSLLPSLLTVLAGLIFSVPLLMWYSAREVIPAAWAWAGLLAVAGVVCLHPRVFLAITNAALRKLGRKTIDTAPSAGRILHAVAVIFARFCVLGLGVWLAARSIAEVPLEQSPLLAGAAVFAGVVGFLAFFAPAGIGVREGLHLLILGPVIGPSTAALLTVLLRLMDVLADISTGTVGSVLVRRTLRGRSRKPAATMLSGKAE